MKKEKSIFVASILNFIVWGSGYYYLNKNDVRGYVAFVLYVIISIATASFILTSSLLILPVLFWVIFWSTWISIFLFYDIYKPKKIERPSQKVIKVKKVVHRFKVRTRKR
jgi:hypothetical protein